MEKELKVCPFCQSADVAVGNNRLQRRAQVYCRNCGAAGPLRNSIEEFIESWNAAPRPNEMDKISDKMWNTGLFLERLCESYRALNNGDCSGCDLLPDKICPLHNGLDNRQGNWLYVAKRLRNV